MVLEVLVFAALRERVGSSRLERSASPGETVGAFVERLRTEFPALPPLGPALRLAVNEEFVGEGHVLSAGDVVALLPPVSGG